MPRTREENKKILEKRKQEIINCAIDVFTVKDIKSAAIDDITKKLKISHGLFYHYFKNKEDLIKCILLYAKETIMVEFASISENYQGVKFFEKFISQFLTLVQKREKALLMNLLMKISREVLIRKAKTSIGSTEFDNYHDSSILTNLKILSAQGKLIQSVETTSRILYIILDGIVDTVIEKQDVKIPVTAKSILKTFIKYSEL